MFEICQDKKAWDKFLNNNIEYPYYTQIYEWLEVLVAVFKNLEMYPLIFVEEGKIKDIIPFIYDKDSRILSSPSPFGGLGGLYHTALYPVLIKEIKNRFFRQRKINYIQIFSLKKIDSILKLFNQKILMQINLAAPGIRIKNLSNKKFKQHLGKSQKLGVKVRIVNLNADRIDWIYQLYCQTMRKNRAKLIFPKELFDNIVYLFKNYIVFFECFLPNAQLIGYNIAFFFKNTISTWFTISDYKYKEYFPATLLFNEMLSYAEQQNIKVVDYGPDASGKSTYEFKRRAGAKPTYYYHYIYPLSLKGNLFYYKNQLREFLKRR